MSDASTEHLAPVTYLPWVGDGGETTGASPSSSRRASSNRGPSSIARSSNESDSGETSPGARSTARRRRSGTRETEPAAGETGVERDERIDRLVVSRLRRSALSVAEVRAVLVEHGLDEHEVEEWLERYERYGYLDDVRLTEQIVHQHGLRRGKGSSAIMSELVRRGIDAGLARAVIDDDLGPEVEQANATAVAERRARQLAGLDRATAERRLSAFLQRRGYSGDVVREAVTAALPADDS